jgi:hypothetical protein
VSREICLRKQTAHDNVSSMAKKKNAGAQALVKLRNKKLSPERRAEIASSAARAKWAKWKAASK